MRPKAIVPGVRLGAGTVEAAVECPRCQAANEPEARFCASCGAALIAPEAAAEVLPLLEDGGALRPKTLGDLVSSTFRLYADNFAPLLVMSFLAQTPSLAAEVTPAPLSWLFTVVGLVLLFLVAGPMVHAVAQATLGREIRLDECVGRARQRVAYLIVAAIIVLLLSVGAALLSLLLVGIPLFIYLVVALAFYVHAIMFEGADGISALGRSRELVRGSWWRVFGIMLVFGIISGVILMVVSIPGFILAWSDLASGSINSLAGIYFGVINIIALPVGLIAGTLIYFDLRVRKEGYTLEQLAADVDG